ncbi:MAG: ATP-binding protein [Candidatus Omnitrophota bacterium]|jgi:DNA helicase HerA-like ATPase|nr:MAG: ATP-binding protein [Candidatus Omnitrophota bacterium]
MTNLICSVYRFFEGEKRFFRITFDRFLETLEKDKKELFTIHELYEFVCRQKPPSQFGEKEKHLRCMSVFEDLVNFVGKLVSQELLTGYSLDEIIESENSCIFLYPDIPDPVYRIFWGYFNLYLIELRDKNVDKKINANNVVFGYEEIHHLAPKMPPGEYSVFADCARKGREYGVSLAFTSHTTVLDDLLLSNLYCQVFKQMTNPIDLRYVRELLKLSKDQEIDLTRLNNTQGIVFMAGHRPYKCVFPYIDLQEIINA